LYVISNDHQLQVYHQESFKKVFEDFTVFEIMNDTSETGGNFNRRILKIFSSLSEKYLTVISGRETIDGVKIIDCIHILKI
jgi:hypothetical protein